MVGPDPVKYQKFYLAMFSRIFFIEERLRQLRVSRGAAIRYVTPKLR